MTTPGNVRRRSAGGDYGEKPLRRYKLTATLAPGGSAQAYWVEWDSTAGAYEPFDGSAETFTDSFTLYSGPNNASGSSGSIGYCAYFADRQQWEVIAGGAAVRRVRFVLPEALTTQTSVAGCAVLEDWYSNAGETSVTVYNEDGWQGDAGASGLADWNPSTSRWVIILLPCPQGTS